MSDKKKRYVLAKSIYIYAENDEKAFELADKIIETEKSEYDNECSMIFLMDASDPIGRKNLTDKFKKWWYDKIELIF